MRYSTINETYSSCDIYELDVGAYGPMLTLGLWIFPITGLSGSRWEFHAGILNFPVSMIGNLKQSTVFPMAGAFSDGWSGKFSRWQECFPIAGIRILSVFECWTKVYCIKFQIASVSRTSLNRSEQIARNFENTSCTRTFDMEYKMLGSTWNFGYPFLCVRIFAATDVTNYWHITMQHSDYNATLSH